MRMGGRESSIEENDGRKRKLYRCGDAAKKRKPCRRKYGRKRTLSFKGAWKQAGSPQKDRRKRKFCRIGSTAEKGGEEALHMM